MMTESKEFLFSPDSSNSDSNTTGNTGNTGGKDNNTHTNVQTYLDAKREADLDNNEYSQYGGIGTTRESFLRSRSLQYQSQTSSERSLNNQIINNRRLVLRSANSKTSTNNSSKTSSFNNLSHSSLAPSDLTAASEFTAEQVFLNARRELRNKEQNAERGVPLQCDESLACEMEDVGHFLTSLRDNSDNLEDNDKDNNIGPNSSSSHVHINSNHSTSNRYNTVPSGNTNNTRNARRFSMASRLPNVVVTYPADSYSFLILYGPIQNPWFFSFGLGVFLFQFLFLIFAILSVTHPRWNTLGDVDNPSDSFIATFIPANVCFLVRSTQIVAVLSYCLFADSSLKDVITAIEIFPNFKKITKSDNYWCMVFSCYLRLIQGLLTVFATLLLIITSTDVMDIILDFMAMNFISNIGKLGFELALWGKYGPKLEAEARKIETRPMPKCMVRHNNQARYFLTIIPLCASLMILMTLMIIGQEKDSIWTTNTFRVQFDDKTGLESYSGCYDKTDHVIGGFGNHKRKTYEGFPDNTEVAKFGYCHVKRRWFLFNGEQDDACSIEREEEVAHSSYTLSFDVSTAFDNPWYSVRGTPLDLYFFEDMNKEELKDSCNSFLNNGKCDDKFNKPNYQYDGGDCCASTCTKSDCGVGDLHSAFGGENMYGDGFPNCKDPDMVPITILFDDIFNSDANNSTGTGTGTGNVLSSSLQVAAGTSSSSMIEPTTIIEPIMLLDCDDTNILTVHVNENMAGQMETVMVEDGANCTIRIHNSTSTSLAFKKPIWYVNYTIFHGDKATIEDDPIVILQEQSETTEFAIFQRIPDCYLKKLSDHIDKRTIYTGTGPMNQAIQWLRLTSRTSRNSRCEDDFFIERYALSVLNFAAPIIPKIPTQEQSSAAIDIPPDRHGPRDLSSTGNNTTSSLIITSTTPSVVSHSGIEYKKLWIDENRQCIWRSVECNGRSIVGLHLHEFDLTGIIPSAIGALTSLTKIDIAGNRLSGTIPSEVGLLTSLKTLIFDGNFLTGSIPTEIGNMKSLEVLHLFNNSLTGYIPSELLKLATLNLTHIFVGKNDLTLTGAAVPKNLSGIVHTECVVCSSGEFRERERVLEEEEEEGGGQYDGEVASTSKSTAATAKSPCFDLMAKFETNKHMLTVADCDELKKNCFRC